jgi:hypothetical protein
MGRIDERKKVKDERRKPSGLFINNLEHIEIS